MRENLERLGKIFQYIFSYSLAFLWLIPLLWMLITSFKPEGSVVTIISELLKPPFTLDSYIKVQNSAMILRWTANSFIIALVQTAGTLLVCSLAAFALSQINFKFKKAVFLIILAGLMIPVEATIVPLYTMVVKLGWVNSYKALILPSIALPLGVLILKQFYDNIPKELTEAASIDGAGLFKIWRIIFVPLSKTALASLGIFVFIQSWNNYLWPLLVASDAEMMTLPVAVPTFQSSFNTNMSVPMAANVLASLPAIIIFLIFQKNIVKGITMTGIK